MSEIEINKYSLGKIYKILNTETDDVYVGSTCMELSERFKYHLWIKDKKEWRKLYALMKLIGSDLFYIELVELYPCETKEQLREREGYHIKAIGTLNMCVAGRTQVQYRSDNKETLLLQKKNYYDKNKDVILEQQQKHYEQNKEIIQERQKKYRESHTEEISLQKKAYYEENKTKINEYKKDWYEKNKEAVIARVKANSEVNHDQKLEYYKKRYQEKKEALSVKIECVCGGCYTVMSKAKHLKTKLHTKYEESKE